MQSIYLIKTSAYGTRKDLVREKVEIKSSNIIKQYKINFDDVTKVYIKEQKQISLFNLINQPIDIDKIYLFI